MVDKLPVVQAGQPHVAAHNNERSAINSLIDLLGDLTFLTDPQFEGLAVVFGPEGILPDSEDMPNTIYVALPVALEVS